MLSTIIMSGGCHSNPLQTTKFPRQDRVQSKSGRYYAVAGLEQAFRRLTVCREDGLADVDAQGKVMLSGRLYDFDLLDG
jgi:hypothetical protein